MPPNKSHGIVRPNQVETIGPALPKLPAHQHKQSTNRGVDRRASSHPVIGLLASPGISDTTPVSRGRRQIKQLQNLQGNPLKHPFHFLVYVPNLAVLPPQRHVTTEQLARRGDATRTATTQCQAVVPSGTPTSALSLVNGVRSHGEQSKRKAGTATRGSGNLWDLDIHSHAVSDESRFHGLIRYLMHFRFSPFLSNIAPTTSSRNSMTPLAG